MATDSIAVLVIVDGPRFQQDILHGCGNSEFVDSLRSHRTAPRFYLSCRRVSCSQIVATLTVSREAGLLTGLFSDMVQFSAR